MASGLPRLLIVMIIAVDFPALHIPCVLDAARLLLCDLAIGGHPVFHFLYALLTLLQARSFLLVEFAGFHAGINMLSLISLTRINARPRLVIGYWGRGLRKHDCGQHSHCDYRQSFVDLHYHPPH